jgi:hypothetical protein
MNDAARRVRGTEEVQTVITQTALHAGRKTGILCCVARPPAAAGNVRLASTDLGNSSAFRMLRHTKLRCSPVCLWRGVYPISLIKKSKSKPAGSSLKSFSPPRGCS